MLIFLSFSQDTSRGSFISPAPIRTVGDESPANDPAAEDQERSPFHQNHIFSQQNICTFYCQHLFGTLFALIFGSGTDYALFWCLH